MIDFLEPELPDCMKQILDNRMAIRAAGVMARQLTCWNTDLLQFFDKKNENSMILKKLSRGMWDAVWQNAVLLVVGGLVYRDFSKACKGGNCGWVEKCVQTLLLMCQEIMHFKRRVGTWVTYLHIIEFALIVLCSALVASSGIIEVSLAPGVWEGIVWFLFSKVNAKRGLLVHNTYAYRNSY